MTFFVAEEPMKSKHVLVPALVGDCKTTQQSRSGNTMKMAFSCSKPPSSGEGQITFVSPEAYTTKMVMTSMASGKPQKVDMESRGKWLGADCGNIKPITPPRKGCCLLYTSPSPRD